MKKPAPIAYCWFIRDGEKLIQCTKAGFDKAIVEGKSVKYRGYANKKADHIAEQLEASRMAFLADPALSPKFRAAITNPENVCEVQIIQVDDPLFWIRESKRPKYQL
jgi:hypothetical protein